jgi:ABC-2 type transport system permease protein
VASPIADLSYRGYDGPLASPRMRWWVIARVSMRIAMRRKSYWVWMAGAAWYFLMMIIIVFFVEQAAAAAGNAQQSERFLRGLIWKDQFLHGFSFGQLIFLILTLTLGAGAIANDNRSNALLVYLSKPCTKFDYLFGKWMGIFMPLGLAMLAPSLFFYLWGALSYRQYGFFADPWLIGKLVALISIAAALHASLILGVSSLFNQGRLAGATYAGIYFMTNFFTQLVVVTWNLATMPRGRGRGLDVDFQASDLLASAYYFSIDGLQIGLAKAILGTNGGPYFGIDNRIRPVPAPSLESCLLIVAAISLAMIFLAWRRVRAVEIIG